MGMTETPAAVPPPTGYKSINKTKRKKIKNIECGAEWMAPTLIMANLLSN